MKNKGFTLVELIIIIAILAIIMLIGSVSYAAIMKRQRVRADRATGAQIGKSINVAEVDGRGEDIPDFPDLIPYNRIDSIGDYIATDIIPQSAPNGYFFAMRVPTQKGRKTVIGIIIGDEEEEEITLDRIYDGNHSGLVYTDGQEIIDFIEAVKREEEETGNTIISTPIVVPDNAGQTPVVPDESKKLLLVGIGDLMNATVFTPIDSTVEITGSSSNWNVSGIDEQTENTFTFTMPSHSVQIYMQ